MEHHIHPALLAGNRTPLADYEARCFLWRGPSFEGN